MFTEIQFGGMGFAWAHGTIVSDVRFHYNATWQMRWIDL